MGCKASACIAAAFGCGGCATASGTGWPAIGTDCCDCCDCCDCSRTSSIARWRKHTLRLLDGLLLACAIHKDCQLTLFLHKWSFS